MSINAKNNPSTLPTVLAAQIEKEPAEQQWLIKPLWTNMAVGILGGAPKLGKSWLGLDMAVSIASDTLCLGQFPVEQRGPVLIYLAEDALCSVRTRIENICMTRNLKIEDLPLHVITAPSLRLDLLDHQKRLSNTIAEIQPKMLLLDPLVRLHRLNENDAQEISGILGFLRGLQRSFRVAIVLVHHASKKHRSNPGQALRGSSDLHAFGDSNAYLKRMNNQLILTLEHRSAPSPEAVTLELISKPDQNQTHLAVVHSTFLPERSNDLAESILELLEISASPLFRKEIRSRLKVNNHRLGLVLTMLEKKGLLERTKLGWKKKTAPANDQTLPSGSTQKQSALASFS